MWRAPPTSATRTVRFQVLSSSRFVAHELNTLGLHVRLGREVPFSAKVSTIDSFWMERYPNDNCIATPFIQPIHSPPGSSKL